MTFAVGRVCDLVLNSYGYKKGQVIMCREDKIVMDLSGLWLADTGDGRTHRMKLPGTLDENRIGEKDAVRRPWHPDTSLGNKNGVFGERDIITTRYTRVCTYEGPVSLTRRISYVPEDHGRLFLEVERARCLRLLVDGEEIPDYVPACISTPHVFEVTGKIHGEHTLTFISDNSYPGLPHDDIMNSSAAADETQTNWNGLLGYLRLRAEPEVFISSLTVLPADGMLTVKVVVDAGTSYKGMLVLDSDALEEPVRLPVCVEPGRSELVKDGLKIRQDAEKWDIYEGKLYSMTAGLDNGFQKKVIFGIRDFCSNAEGHLALNGRPVFLRCETNCAVFPETGYCPMKKEEWEEILKTYWSYGANCVRFHSHCPPEEAFEAADTLGILMYPELSHWNPVDAFESEESFRYYQTELLQILRTLANHPSFVILTLGNELHASGKGHKRMRTLLEMARKEDPTRLYAEGSNVHYGEAGCEENADFYSAFRYYGEDLRSIFEGMEGYLNHSYPGADHTYDEAMEHVRRTCRKPVFGFETGQFESLPDFGELEEFHGVTIPDNLRAIEKRMKEAGLSDIWKDYVSASGELARICYREEVEAAMRTRQFSGISLLGLQDFPGQGTALVGMMNSHLKPKPFPFARPERFREFFKDQCLLVFLPKYTYENTEILRACVRVANYGKTDVKGKLYYELQPAGIRGCCVQKAVCPAGSLTEAGMIEIPLQDIKEPARMDLKVRIGDVTGVYPVWVYPEQTPACPEGIYETQHFDLQAEKVLEAGGRVYLTPPSTKEAMPSSIQAQFSTDFWSVGTFSKQEGGMGQFIDAGHPLFRRFPTEFHTNWQWWPMAVQRALILPQRRKAIVTEMDSFAYFRPMAQLLECRCGNGKLMLSSMGLQDLQQYPEARALLSAVYSYMDSGDFSPEQEIEPEVIRKLVWRKGTSGV